MPIYSPYDPRALWDGPDGLHEQISRHRFSVLVAHRRFGKTVGVVNHLIREAMLGGRRDGRYGYIAPFRSQAKQIAWDYLKHYSACIPGISINESDLAIDYPSGSRIRLFGADNPDALRGMYFDLVVLDEVAQMRSEVWGEIIRPALSDRKGGACFIGTPHGQNLFHDLYQRARREPDWFAGMYRADETGVIPPEELKAMIRDMTDAEARQELYCDFTASAYNVLITIDLVAAAVTKEYNLNDIVNAPKIIGIDIARFGNDRSVICRRQGLNMFDPIVINDIDNMGLASRVAREIDEWTPDAVFIDAGRGEGVIDRLRQLGYQVLEIQFGGRAIKDSRYVNRRSEMWDGMRLWLEAGGSIPNISDLKTDLTTPEYTMDPSDRMKLEPKDKIKERIGKSTDLGDALALTFASPVATRERQQCMENFSTVDPKYNPLDRFDLTKARRK